MIVETTKALLFDGMRDDIKVKRVGKEMRHSYTKSFQTYSGDSMKKRDKEK